MKRPKLGPWLCVIDAILEADKHKAMEELTDVPVMAITAMVDLNTVLSVSIWQSGLQRSSVVLEIETF